MMTKLLVDTNVLIYALNQDSVYHNSAKPILLNPNYNFFITSKNVSEFFAVTSKLKISYQSSLNFYEELKTNTNILFPTEKSLPIFEKLIKQYQPKGNQVFDVEIVSIMLDNNINHIATFNQKDFIRITEVQIIKL